MRVVQVDLGDRRLYLHPYLTIIRGLDDKSHDRLVDTFAGLPEGRAAASGMIEAHGIFLDLTDDALALLDLPNPGIEAVDVVVRPSDVAEVFGDGVLARRELHRQREEVAERVAAAAEAHRQARERHDAAVAVAERARAELGHANDLEADARAELEQAEARRDPIAAALLSENTAGDDADRDAPGVVDAVLLAVGDADPTGVEAALAQLSESDEVELVVSDEAIRLADQWVANEAALSAESSVGQAASMFSAARQRVEAAHARLAEIEGRMRARGIDRSDIEALEDAHEAVLVARERSNKRFGGGRARQKLEEAEAAEQEILDRLGFETYSAFLMGTSILHVDETEEDELDAARAEAAEAEDALARLEQGIDAEFARAELLARRRALREEATSLLGYDPGDDLEWVLRHHRVERRVSGEATRRLRAALEGAGMIFGDEEVPQALLVQLATNWLDAQRDAAGERAAVGEVVGELDPRLREVEAEISARRAELHAAELAVRDARGALVAAEAEVEVAARLEHDAAGALAAVQAELDAASAAEQEAAATLAGVADLLDRVRDGDTDLDVLRRSVDAAEVAVADADADVDELRRELAALDERLAAPVAGGDAAITSPEAAEELAWYLLSRLARQRDASFAGALPALVDDAFATVHGAGLDHL